MSKLADVPMPDFRPNWDWEMPEALDWDVPRSVGIVGGLLALAGLGYVMYKLLNEDDMEDLE